MVAVVELVVVEVVAVGVGVGEVEIPFAKGGDDVEEVVWRRAISGSEEEVEVEAEMFEEEVEVAAT